MDITMEFDDFKSAWKLLDARLARQNRLQFELLLERKLDQARRNLRPLLVGAGLQLVLGIGLVVLGVGCWRQNLQIPGLLATGIALHAFGVLNIALAGMVAGLASTQDYNAPVLLIQKRLRLLLRVQVLNSAACGLPWWIMWVLVVVGFAGLSPDRAAGPTPSWIWISLAVGVAGIVATWVWSLRTTHKRDRLLVRVDDGADGIRRNLRLLDELDQFEGH